MTFRVGQKVVCVRDRPIGKEIAYATGPRSTKIRVGEVYTVRDFDTRALHIHGVACVRLFEVVNEVKETCIGPWEGGYPAPCFRPVLDAKKKTDISVFTALLNPQHHKPLITSDA
jgi:hypothetical protein